MSDPTNSDQNLLTMYTRTNKEGDAQCMLHFQMSSKKTLSIEQIRSYTASLKDALFPAQSWRDKYKEALTRNPVEAQAGWDYHFWGTLTDLSKKGRLFGWEFQPCKSQKQFQERCTHGPGTAIPTLPPVPYMAVLLHAPSTANSTQKNTTIFCTLRSDNDMPLSTRHAILEHGFVTTTFEKLSKEDLEDMAASVPSDNVSFKDLPLRVKLHQAVKKLKADKIFETDLTVLAYDDRQAFNDLISCERILLRTS